MPASKLELVPAEMSYDFEESMSEDGAASSSSDSSLNALATTPSQIHEQNERAKRCRAIRRFFLVFFTISIGVVGLMWGQDLGVIEALYVITQVVTTIGYGDITVDTDIERFLMAIYALWILVLVAYFLNQVIQRALDKRVTNVRTRLRQFERACSRYLNPDVKLEDDDIKLFLGKYNQLMVASGVFAVHVLFGMLFYSYWESCSCSYGALEVAGCNVTNACDIGYTINKVEAFYMSVITLTTVGFGDYSPRTMSGRLIGIIWMLSGIVSTAGFLEALQGVFFKLSEERMVDEADLVHEQMFNKLDDNGDGTLSKSEFIHYVLLKQHLIDPEIIDSISNMYDKIDADHSKTITLPEVMAYQTRRTKSRVIAQKSICAVM